ncbi:uncharacterized protein B0P05DRAFT_560188 [Gilbertella persicaria]|uniref:uncharacterized protein n=1 Tax=Gilbertella persicaria TaxID=101096 RepID=UPI002220D731|nr:uncharacterized protein B0P05DRAFT_560188 [Gilbertella persicaria]KAI8056279.1 hypothetical protein B0P05DRAFT_560188 [Gilbertella persicaria]
MNGSETVLRRFFCSLQAFFIILSHVARMYFFVFKVKKMNTFFSVNQCIFSSNLLSNYTLDGNRP